MADETTQADAAALVAMTVAELAMHLDGVDLPTLAAALELEKAATKPRAGAVAALEAAIAGHPEQAEAAAQAADAAEAPVEQPAPETPADEAPTPDIPVLVAVPETPAEVEPLADAPADPDAVSSAPPRPHDSLVSALELRWIELKDFARGLEGEVEGELGELLTFVRSKL